MARSESDLQRWCCSSLLVSVPWRCWRCGRCCRGAPLFSLAFLTLAIGGAVLAPVVAPYDPIQNNPVATLAPQLTTSHGHGPSGAGHPQPGHLWRAHLAHGGLSGGVCLWVAGTWCHGQRRGERLGRHGADAPDGRLSLAAVSDGGAPWCHCSGPVWPTSFW